MKYILLLIVIALTGCVETKENNNHGYGYNYDWESPTYKFKVRGLPPGIDNFETFNRLYQETAWCLNKEATPAPDLYIILTSTIEDKNGNTNYNGMYTDTPPLILLWNLVWPWQIETTIRHEFIHHFVGDYNHTIFTHWNCQ